jgi:hypothetical protein
MFHARRPPHVRGRIGGDTAAAVVARLNAATAATMGEPQASPMHHPKTGIMEVPRPYEGVSPAHMRVGGTAYTYGPAHMPSAVDTPGTKLYDPYEAAVEEANKTELYAGMPFRGSLRAAAKRGR